MTGRYADLAGLLSQIRTHDADYPTRYRLVLAALAEAHRLGLLCGIGYDFAASAVAGFRVVAYIDLPAIGQVSWHLPEYPGRWDGHTTDTKLARLAAFAAAHRLPTHGQEH